MKMRLFAGVALVAASGLSTMTMVDSAMAGARLDGDMNVTRLGSSDSGSDMTFVHDGLGITGAGSGPHHGLAKLGSDLTSIAGVGDGLVDSSGPAVF